MIIRGTPNASKLKHIYNTIQRLIDNKECYYTEEEIENLKKDKTNIFLVRENTHEKRRT